MRYVPKVLGGASFFGSFTGYPVKAILPDSFMMRRNNKGLENVAVSPNGKTAWTMMQVGGAGSCQLVARTLLRCLNWLLEPCCACDAWHAPCHTSLLQLTRQPQPAVPLSLLLQSAMGDDDSAATKASFTLTAAKLDLSDPLNATLVGVYLYIGEHSLPAPLDCGMVCAWLL